MRHTSPRDDKTVTARDGRLAIRDALADNGLRFEAQVQVVTQGGTRADDGDTVTVSGADSVMLVLSAGTGHADRHPAYRGTTRTPRSPPPWTRRPPRATPTSAGASPAAPTDEYAAAAPAAPRRTTGRWRRCSSPTAATC
ncbi:glycoside hydrolase N-terminal domain-containing protein [Nonomuraea indica]|uniref:Glycoside hydrolase N-terminal domain-containing protein n=1 Tax=Nonomuraea indica TaxID=1581193 RepID=A0ABW7ZYM1_9ACTN